MGNLSDVTGAGLGRQAVGISRVFPQTLKLHLRAEARTRKIPGRCQKSSVTFELDCQAPYISESRVV